MVMDSGAQALWNRVCDRSDTVLLPGFVVFMAAALFVAARLLAAADSDVSRFVVAGDKFVNPAKAPHELSVQPGRGYDGQFYYRIALDPSDLRRRADGIGVDNPLRFERIAYPALAWLFAAGRPGLVPWSLVAVNLVGLGTLGLLGGVIARSAGRHAAWGLLLPGWAGFLFTTGRDLTEVITTVGVVAGLLAWRRGRPALAGGALAVAVMARETAMLVVAAVVAAWMWRWWRDRGRPRLEHATLAWGIPTVTFLAWQLVCRLDTGAFPLLTGSRDNVVQVGTGRHDGLLGGLSPASASLKVAQFVLLLLVGVLLLWRLRYGGVPIHEPLAWLLAAVLAIRVLPLVWNDWADFRVYSDLYALAMIPVLSSRLRLGPLAVAVGAIWLATAVQLAVVI
jgi:hypothetical protein